MIEKTRIVQSAMSCDVKTLKYALQNGDNINTLDYSYLNLLMYAVIFGTFNKEEYIKQLYKYGIYMNQQNKLGQTALHLAAAKSDLNTVKQLCGLGVQVNTLDNEGNNALMYACRSIFSNYPYLIKNLGVEDRDVFYLENCVKSWNSDKKYKLELLEAQLSIIKYLLESGTNKDQVNNYGFSAMDYAIDNYNIKDTKMVELLKEYDVPIVGNHDTTLDLSNFFTEKSIIDLRKKKLKAIR